MEWVKLYDDKENILIVKSSGILDLESTNRLLEDCLKEIAKINCRKILLDLRSIDSLNIGTFGIHSIPNTYTKRALPRNLRLAVVSIKEYASDYDFFETVCHNSGYMVNVFYDYEEALEWLKK